MFFSESVNLKLSYKIGNRGKSVHSLYPLRCPHPLELQCRGHYLAKLLPKQPKTRLKYIKITLKVDFYQTNLALALIEFFQGGQKIFMRFALGLKNSQIISKGGQGGGHTNFRANLPNTNFLALLHHHSYYMVVNNHIFEVM